MLATKTAANAAKGKYMRRSATVSVAIGTTSVGERMIIIQATAKPIRCATNRGRRRAGPELSPPTNRDLHR